MADTGAPWNIPFVEPTDLVRDYPAADEAQALAVAAGLTAAGNAGIGSNVASTVKTNAFQTSSTSPQDVTGLAVTITPTTPTSKILVIAQVSTSGVAGSADSTYLRVNGGNMQTFIGDADGSRTRATSFRRRQASVHESDMDSFAVTMIYLSSPETTSPLTFQVQSWVGAGGTASINRSGIDTNNVTYGRTASSITAIEVAA